MIREQKFYDMGDFTPERLAQVGQQYVADADEDTDQRSLAGEEVGEDTEPWFNRDKTFVAGTDDPWQ